MLSYGQQNFTISGLVRDKSSGEPLIGANVLVSPSVKLKASYVGYKPFQQILNLTGDLRFDILLEPGLELAEVEVTATRPIEERLELGMTELPAAQVKQMPMLGEPDVLKAMQLLPGVQGGSDGRSGLYVRGGSPDTHLLCEPPRRFCVGFSSRYPEKHQTLQRRFSGTVWRKVVVGG